MNFPGVLARIPSASTSSPAFDGAHIDGHAPLLRGLPLNGYLAAGIRTDHETTTRRRGAREAAQGHVVLIREGSVSKDVDALAPLLTRSTSPFFAFCTDDRNPLDIAEEGHLDPLIRRAIAAGGAGRSRLSRRLARRRAAFGLRDRGLIAPGQRADIVLLDDLEACAVPR